ncbi:RDD family protein [Speluncibacter jeojiensis]|uniref:RDD family protein n=1 Tax=Speluncibacter jeojiensis TaxID=2710754 RepID=A0A9X4RFM5_9ACTN|nr:RDD family protein [Corynebacteriales bacterium D3-21]
MVGWAIVVAGLVLALSVAVPWATVNGEVSGASVHASITGAGTANVQADTGMGSEANRFVEQRAKEAYEAPGGSPGGSAIPLGIVATIAGWVLLRTRFRWQAALVAGGVGVVGVIWTMSVLTDVRGTFVFVAPVAVATQAPAFGLLAAMVMCVALVALGITALVYERQVAALLAASPTSSASTMATAGSSFHGLAPGSRQDRGRVAGSPASLGYRVAALGIDLVIVASACAALGFAFGFAIDTGALSDALAAVAAIAVALVPFGYRFLCEAGYGKTVGKRIVGLGTIGESGALPTAGESFRRNAFLLVLFAGGIGIGLWELTGTGMSPTHWAVIVAAVMLLVAGVIALTILINPRQQGIHDRLAGGTRVIHLPRRTPVPQVQGRVSFSTAPWVVAFSAIVVAVLVTGSVSSVILGQESGSSVALPASGEVATSSSTPTPGHASAGQSSMSPFAYERLSPGACADPSYPDGNGTCTVSSPSGNFICTMFEREVSCTSPPGEPVVDGAMVPIPGSTDGSLAEANVISVDNTGQTQLGLITNGRSKATTREQARSSAIPYNHRLTAYGFTCAVDREGMHCRNDATGHGFSVAREGYEFF